MFELILKFGFSKYAVKLGLGVASDFAVLSGCLIELSLADYVFELDPLCILLLRFTGVIRLEKMESIWIITSFICFFYSSLILLDL